MGQMAFDMVWLWFAGAFLLGGVIAYGTIRAGRLRRSERERLDRNTEAVQRQEDPQKRPF